jgi:Na+/melibiose symporter-like transporter
VHEVRGSDTLAVLIAADGAASMFLALIIPVELVFVTGSLGGSEADFGVVLAAWGVGAVIGSAALSPLSRVSTERLLLAGASTMVAGYLGMGAAADVTTVVAFSLLGGVGNGLAAPTMLTAVQSARPATSNSK